MVFGLGPSAMVKTKSSLASLDLAIRSQAIFDPKRYAETVTELANAVRNPVPAKSESAVSKDKRILP